MKKNTHGWWWWLVNRPRCAHCNEPFTWYQWKRRWRTPRYTYRHQVCPISVPTPPDNGQEAA